MAYLFFDYYLFTQKKAPMLISKAPTSPSNF